MKRFLLLMLVVLLAACAPAKMPIVAADKPVPKPSAMPTPTPTRQEKLVDEFWGIYQAKPVLYKGYWEYDMATETPQDKCNVMLQNYVLINWGRPYDELFKLCSDETSNHNSMAHLWSVDGMSPWQTMYEGEYIATESLSIMSFMNPPLNSEVLGTITPCTTPVELIRGFTISKVEPATDPFNTIYSNWIFDASEGFDVIVEYPGYGGAHTTISVLRDAYIGYIGAEDFANYELDVLDNRPAQSENIYLYQVTDCP